MKKTQLSSSEIQDLIGKYKSERKKLEFQISEVDYTISQLESTIKSVAGLEKAAILKTKKRKSTKVVIAKAATGKKRGRPAKKTEVAKKAPLTKKALKTKKSAKAAKKAVEKKATKSKIKKGYKLSNWDLLVVNSLKDSGKVRITQEIIDYVGAKMKESGKNVSEVEVKNKVIRSLQKLANRRGELKKASFAGKGFAYALPEWMNDKGKLNQDHKR
jgi:hypothetical protein